MMLPFMTLKSCIVEYRQENGHYIVKNNSSKPKTLIQE